jgi:release factor glutamine methyltransferase
MRAAASAPVFDLPARPLRLGEALGHARRAGLPTLEAQWLLLHALGRPTGERAWLLAHDEETLPATARQRYVELCTQRLAGVPLAYLVGERGFFGLTLQVDARVLDPRPDTETLVEWALQVLAAVPRPRVLDLGTGSGAIALAIQHQRPDAEVWAVDLSTDALAVARANGERLALPVHWIAGDWWSDWRPTPGDSTPIPSHFHAILSNPPYIRADDPHLPALRHEPTLALVGGDDGLQALRRIIAGAPARLEPGGWLLLEHGWDQADAVAALLRDSGLVDIAHRLDLGGHRRCTGGQRPRNTP